MDDDLFDSLLGLEDQYYQEGYGLGIKDGTLAGLTEGRLFGLERGFEKYAAMGLLHGRSLVWAGRLPQPRAKANDDILSQASTIGLVSGDQQHDVLPVHGGGTLPALGTLNTGNARVEKHIRTLYALTETSSLSTVNDEASVSDFDDRLRRAQGKTKVIENSIGEASLNVQLDSSSRKGVRKEDVNSQNSEYDSNIEDGR